MNVTAACPECGQDVPATVGDRAVPDTEAVREALAELDRATVCSCDVLPDEDGHWMGCSADLRRVVDVVRAALASDVPTGRDLTTDDVPDIEAEQAAVRAYRRYPEKIAELNHDAATIVRAALARDDTAPPARWHVLDGERGILGSFERRDDAVRVRADLTAHGRADVYVARAAAGPRAGDTAVSGNEHDDDEHVSDRPDHGNVRAGDTAPPAVRDAVTEIMRDVAASWRVSPPEMNTVRSESTEAVHALWAQVAEDVDAWTETWLAAHPVAAAGPRAGDTGLDVRAEVKRMVESNDRLRAEVAAVKQQRDYLQGQLDRSYYTEYYRNDTLKRRIAELEGAGNALADGFEHFPGLGVHDYEERALIDAWRSAAGSKS